jgi:hypothetical protein
MATHDTFLDVAAAPDLRRLTFVFARRNNQRGDSSGKRLAQHGALLMAAEALR